MRTSIFWMGPTVLFGGERRETERVVRTTAALLGCFMVACQAPLPPSPERVAVTREQIIDGSRDTSSDSVVAVVAQDSSSRIALCSGSVIGPYHVMTAKHCVFDEAGKRRPASAFTVAVGNDLTVQSGVSAVSRVSDVRTTPGSDIDTDVRNGDDIAILLCSSKLRPTALRTATRGPDVGSEVTIIGFGRTMPGVPDQSDAGIKFIGTTEVTGLDSHLIQTEGDSATCEGDSGGPLLDESGAVAGITSFGLDMECLGSKSLYTRVSRHAALIEGALAWSPSCPDAKPETCNGVDDNCDGVTDEICKAIGESCSANSECEGGLCANIDGRSVCTSSCDPTQALTECPQGTLCRAMGCGFGRCVVGKAGDLNDGTACTTGLECAAGNCGSAKGRALCGRPCRTKGGDACPMGQVCDSSDGTADCGTCVPVELSDALRPFGSPCESDAQCGSSSCAGVGMPGAFCTRNCNALIGCGMGLHCRDGQCAAGSLGTAGSSCVNAMDCGSMASDCAARDGDKVCAPRCNVQSECSGGLECAADDDGVRHCLRVGTALGLPCETGAQCTTGLCSAGQCARVCSVSSPCPLGFTCEASAQMSGSSVCRTEAPAAPKTANAEGGCSAAGAPPAGSGALLVYALLGWLARRRLRA